MPPALEAFLQHAGLPAEYGGHLREFGVERVDDLMELSATGLQGMGIPDISGQVAAAHKTYVPDSTPAAAPIDTKSRVSRSSSSSRPWLCADWQHARASTCSR